MGDTFQAVGTGQGCLRVSITSCFCSTSDKTRGGGDSLGGFPSPVILHSHTGFEFWDVSADRVSYQTRLHCCTSTAPTAWAALPDTQPGFPCHSEQHTPVIRQSCLASSQVHCNRKQVDHSRSQGLQTRSLLSTNKLRRNSDLINSLFPLNITQELL